MKHISIITTAVLILAFSSCEKNVIDLLPEDEIPKGELALESIVATETEITTETTRVKTNNEDGTTTAIVDTAVNEGVGEEPSKNPESISEDAFNGFVGNERSTSLEETTNGDGNFIRMGSTTNTVEVVNVNGVDVEAPESTNTDPASIVTDIQTLVNNHRASIGVNALTLDSFISNLTSEHSRNVAMGVASSLEGVSDRQNALVVEFTLVGVYGENTAQNQTNGAGAVAQWLNTPRQRQDIENATYTHTGIGSYQDTETGIIYYTQIFAEIN